MASRQAQLIAQLHERDRTRVTTASVRTAAAKLLRFRADIIAAYRSGDDPGQAIVRFKSAMLPIVTQTMIGGHLYGRYRATLTTRKNMSALDDALGFVESRLKVSAKDMLGLRDLYTEPATKALVGFSDRIDRKMRDTFADIVKEGLHVRGGVARLNEALTGAGVTAQEPYLLETLVRTQVSLAYAAGRENANADPAVQEILWGYEYVSVGDDRVRPEHAVLDGTRLPKDDPFWSENTPPNGWNCRCTVIEVFDDQSIATPIEAPGPFEVDGRMIIPGADEGWGFNPGELYRDMLKAA